MIPDSIIIQNYFFFFQGSKIPFVSPCDKEMSGYIMFG